jgi:hypothetical protein
LEIVATYVLAGVALLLAIQLATLTVRLGRVEKALRAATRDLPEGASVGAFVERTIERELTPRIERGVQAFEKDLKETILRVVKREYQEILDRPGFHAEIERLISDKLTRGAFLQQVRQALDEHFASVKQYVDRALAGRGGTPAGAPGGSPRAGQTGAVKPEKIDWVG